MFFNHFFSKIASVFEKSPGTDRVESKTSHEDILKKCKRCRHGEGVSRLIEQQHQVIQSSLSMHELYANHIKNVIEKTEDSAAIVLKNSQSTNKSVDNLVNYVNTSMKEEWIDGLKTTIDSSETNNEEMQQFLSTKIEQLKSNFAAAVGIFNSLNEIPKSLEMLDTLAFQIRLISINTSIEAAHLEQEGNGIAAVAEEINKVAISIRQLIKNVEDILQQISVQIQTAFVERFSQKHVTEEQINTDALQHKISDNSGVVKEIYNDLKSFRESTMDKINTESKEVAEMAQGILGSLQYQDIVRQQLEVIIKSLDQSAEKIRAFLANKNILDPANAWQPVDMQQLQNSYVMDSQRKIHTDHLKRQQIDAAKLDAETSSAASESEKLPQIELF